MTSYKPLHPVSTAPPFAECRLGLTGANMRLSVWCGFPFWSGHLNRGKILHTRNQHLRNYRGLSVACSNGLFQPILSCQWYFPNDWKIPLFQIPVRSFEKPLSLRLGTAFFCSHTWPRAKQQGVQTKWPAATELSYLPNGWNILRIWCLGISTR